MDTHIQAIIDRTIERESGFVNHPSDPGGATKYGITFATLQEFRGRPITNLGVMNLTIDEARIIYHQRYWMRGNLDLVPRSFQDFVFDFFINAKDAIKCVQRTWGAKPDGSIGQASAGAANRFLLTHGPGTGLNKMVDDRIRHYIQFVVDRQKNVDFIHGWFNRSVKFYSHNGYVAP